MPKPTEKPIETASGKTYVVASHAALFELTGGPKSTDEERCDVCGEAVAVTADDTFSVSGRGRYLWTRGDERRAEEPPLCPGCAAAIGMTALRLWTAPDDEG